MEGARISERIGTSMAMISGKGYGLADHRE